MDSMNAIIDNEVKKFEENFKNFLDGEVNDYLKSFLFLKSKRLRPLLGILFCKALQIEIKTEHKNIFLAVELIHNASLLHDDVIDESKERRKTKSINEQFDNTLAITSGDLLLSLALEKIIEIKNQKVQKLFSNCMKQMCYGEISQYFSKYKNQNITEYLTKTKQKTALLFELAILTPLILSKKEEYYKTVSSFAENFGLAFQIKNDLKNHTTTKEDYTQGIYTAPIIYGEKDGIEKTKYLINNYLDECEKRLSEITKNEYTETILEIVRKMRE